MNDQRETPHGLTPAGDDCPLPIAVQTRNMANYAMFWCIYYFSAPVSYVGSTHANLLKELGNSDTLNNLPSAVFMWMSIVPVLVAWFFPQSRYLKPLALLAVGIKVVITAAVALVLWCRLGSTLTTWVVVAHAALFGAANGIMITAIWDFLRRSVSTSRRGRALGFAFGIGPLFACAGALLQDAAFDGQLLRGYSFGFEFPDSYFALFSGATLLMMATGIPVAMFVLPASPPTSAEPATTVHEIVAGLRQFARNRTVLCAVAIYVVVYSGGNEILTNLSLHARDVLGEKSNTLGLQTLLRFGFKAVAGALLGWLLARSNPRATLFATTSVLLIGMSWALASSGQAFMVTFGLMGAGELFGAYFPNYVATASAKQFVRINMAYLSILGVLVGFSSIAFGYVSDHWGRVPSFYLAAGLLILAIGLIAWLLPAHPAPDQADA